MAHDARTTEPTFDETMTLNEIVSRHPTALPIFHKHGMDTCCGGAKPLAEVAQRHGLDLEGLMRELREG